MIRFGQPNVVMPHQRNYLFDMMERQCGHEVKAGVPERAVDQRPACRSVYFKKSVDEQDDFGHDERAYKVLGWF